MKNLKNAFQIFVLLFSLSACKTSQTIEIEGQSYQLPNPPKTLKIDDNRFMETEQVTNADYHLYLEYLVAVYKKSSDQYKNAMPAMATDSHELFSAKHKKYFYGNANQQKPLTGISHAQAVNYLNWKSDRVNEFILLEAGVLVEQENSISPSMRPMAREVKKQYRGIKKQEGIPMIQYSLPALEDFQKAMAFTTEKTVSGDPAIAEMTAKEGVNIEWKLEKGRIIEK